MQISQDQATYIIRAVEHYAAYLRATNRDDHEYRDLTESLRRKVQPSERAIPAVKQQRTAARKPRPQRRRR